MYFRAIISPVVASLLTFFWHASPARPPELSHACMRLALHHFVAPPLCNQRERLQENAPVLSHAVSLTSFSLARGGAAATTPSTTVLLLLPQGRYRATFGFGG